jgi:hypothetical protein
MQEKENEIHLIKIMLRYQVKENKQDSLNGFEGLKNIKR